MNRTLTNVLFGGIGSTATQSDYKIEESITKTNVEETVEALSNADNVILVSLLYSSELHESQYYHRSSAMVWLSRKRSMLLQKLFAC